jgi:hypothetical protein
VRGVNHLSDEQRNRLTTLSQRGCPPAC